MRQLVFEFVLDASAAPQVPLDLRAVEDVVRLMAAAIVAVLEQGTKQPGDERSSEQQDQA